MNHSLLQSILTFLWNAETAALSHKRRHSFDTLIILFRCYTGLRMFAFFSKALGCVPLHRVAFGGGFNLLSSGTCAISSPLTLAPSPLHLDQPVSSGTRERTACHTDVWRAVTLHKKLRNPRLFPTIEPEYTDCTATYVFRRSRIEGSSSGRREDDADERGRINRWLF